VQGWKIVLWVAVVLATLTFFYLVRGVLLPFVLGFIVAMILEPIVLKLRHRGVPRGRAVLLVFGLFFSVVLALGVFTVPIITGQVVSLNTGVASLAQKFQTESYNSNYFTRWNPVLRAQSNAQTDVVDNTLTQFQPNLERFGLPSTRAQIFEKYVEPRKSEITKLIQKFMNSFLGVIAGFGSTLLSLLLVPFTALFVLLEFDKLKQNWPTWIPLMFRASTVTTFKDVGEVFANYLRGVSISWAIYTTILAIILTTMGAPYSLLLAPLFGALYLIPLLGSLTSYTALFIITGLSGVTGNWFLSLGNSWAFAGVVLLSMMIFSESYDKAVHGNLVGNAVGLSPLASLFVVFSGGALFGLMGMVLAFPIGGAVKVILEKLIRTTSTVGSDTLGIPAVPLRHRSGDN